MSNFPSTAVVFVLTIVAVCIGYSFIGSFGVGLYARETRVGINSSSTLNKLSGKLEKKCENARELSFWMELDKKQFLELKRRDIRFRNPEPEFSRKQWQNFREKFGCTYFDIEREADLNGDGQKELFVVGEYREYKREFENFVFRKEAGLWRVILFDSGDFIKTRAEKSNGYRDLILTTSFSGSGRNVNRFSFNGKYYQESECLSENYAVRVGGKDSVNDYVTVRPRPCEQWFSHHLKGL